jgi:MHS family proline/betaine transporter-like MFS transporter
MGSTVAALCTLEFMPFWAWRIAFLFGIIVGSIGFYIRKRVSETYFTKILEENKNKLTHSIPLMEVIKKHPSSMLCIMGIAACSGIVYNTSMSYVSIFLTTFQKWPSAQALFIMSFGILSYIFLAPFSGWLADKFGAKIVMISGAIATLLGIYPSMFLLTSETSILSVIIGQLALVILAAWFQGPMNIFMASLFLPKTRYSGLAFSYCTGMAIFGGTTTMIATFLANATGNPLTPVLYVIFGSILGLISVMYAKQKVAIGKEEQALGHGFDPTPAYNPS